MWGANTAELRNQSDVFHMKRDEVSDAFRRSSSAVKECVWEGPDADRFKDEYDASLGAMIDQLCDLLQDRHTDMQRQAQEQDDCSGVGGGSLWDRIKDFLKDVRDGWDTFRNWVKGLRSVRTILETIEAVKDIMKNGLRFTFAAQKAIEEAAQKAGGFLYDASKRLGDFVTGNWKDMGFLKHISPSGNLEKFIADKLDIAANWSEKVFGGAGRALGKFMGGADVLLNAGDAIGKFSQGDWKGGLWSTGKAVLGGLSFVPGPVGLIATGASLGVTAFENREAIGNFVMDTAVPAVSNAASGVAAGAAAGAAAAGFPF